MRLAVSSQAKPNIIPIAGSLIGGVGTFHTAVYVAALLVESREYPAGLCVKFQFAAVVADLFDDPAAYACQINARVAFHLAGHDNLSGGDKRFAGHLRLRILCDEFIEYSIGNLVGHLVRVSFRY